MPPKQLSHFHLFNSLKLFRVLHLLHASKRSGMPANSIPLTGCCWFSSCLPLKILISSRSLVVSHGVFPCFSLHLQPQITQHSHVITRSISQKVYKLYIIYTYLYHFPQWSRFFMVFFHSRLPKIPASVQVSVPQVAWAPPPSSCAHPPRRPHGRCRDRHHSRPSPGAPKTWGEHWENMGFFFEPQIYLPIYLNRVLSYLSMYLSIYIHW